MLLIISVVFESCRIRIYTLKNGSLVGRSWCRNKNFDMVFELKRDNIIEMYHWATNKQTN